MAKLLVAMLLFFLAFAQHLGNSVALAVDGLSAVSDDSGCAAPAGTPLPGSGNQGTLTPVPLSTPTAAGIAAAAENVVACLNSGRLETVVSLTTPNFLRTEIGVDDLADAQAAVAFPPLAVERIGHERLDGHGRGSVEVVYRREAGQHMLVRERWAFVEVDHEWLLDELEPLPIDLAGPRADAAVHVTGHFFELDRGEFAAGDAIVFRIANGDTVPHEFAVFRPTAGQGRDSFVRNSGGDAEFVGAAVAGPGAHAELALVDLEPGSYFIACFFEAPDGESYAMHGMVAEFSVR